MKKNLCLLIVLFSCVLLQAQYKVTFIIKEKTAIIHDSIYVAGTFNSWNDSANPFYLMKPHGEKEKSITLNVKSGPQKYKFHRGNWRNVEKRLDGAEVADRVITIRKDTVLMDSVSAWLDEFFVDKWQTLSQALPDTNRLKIFSALINAYAFERYYYNSDSALHYAQQALELVQKMKASDGYQKWIEDGNTAQIINLQETIAYLLHSLGNYPRALEMRLENLKLAEKERDKFQLLYALANITADYLSMKDYQSMLNYSKQLYSLVPTLNARDTRYRYALFGSKFNIATANYRLNNLFPALAYVKQALAVDSLDEVGIVNCRLLLADIYSAMNQKDSALSNYRYVLQAATTWTGLLIPLTQAGMARVFQKTNQLDSALLYGRQALNNFQNNNFNLQSWGESSLYYVAEISPLLAELYRASSQPDSAYKYLQLSVAAKDSLYNTDKIRQFQTLGFNEANRRLQLEQQSREDKQRYETKIKIYGLISIIIGFVVLAFVLYRNNRQKQQANTLLQSQKQEIETTLGELKITQKQLIQSEKMASLGELTAGIAHEIQNPLNFVNNFSEINKEMIDELQIELQSGNVHQAIAISNDIKDNEVKINHHGKRADAIVKGMLQHSRQSSGTKELTDINALADEYLRLSYHGLRAKDKLFNATLNTNYDNTIGKISIIPQNIGRVLLNLFNNAFYAVAEKQKAAGEDYQPTVFISTKKNDNNIELTISDNGNGIPAGIKEKIFQPFFTTKPTGQGTGLGLSLSYDIVKAHGGELRVESKEANVTTFIILLPAE